MKILYLKQLISIILLVLSTTFIQAQSEEIIIDSKQKPVVQEHSYKINQELNLISTNKSIEHVFNITMSDKDSKKLTKIIDKSYLSNCIITYNKDTLSLNELELRGKSSMEFKRKSFSVKLNNKMSITKNDSTHKFKKFNLISLSMDHNYYRNKVAFDLMNHIGLFNLFYTYAEVVVNGQTQGVYLLVQKPKNYAFKNEDANFMLRRDFQHEINKTYFKGDDTTMIAKYKKAFSSIYNEIIQKEGQIFYEELSKILDVEQYFTWMAFNYFIGNGDYTDEVFFYNKAGNDSIRFGIIPWDYDDIFYDYPREGYLIRYVNFGDKLAFSSEDDLDYVLIYDNYTYTKYLETLKNLIDKLSITVLKDIFESSYQDLYPFYCRKDILKMSKLDKHGKTNLYILESDMQNNFEKLAKKRIEVTMTLDTFAINVNPN